LSFPLAFAAPVAGFRLRSVTLFQNSRRKAQFLTTPIAYLHWVRNSAPLGALRRHDGQLASLAHDSRNVVAPDLFHLLRGLASMSRYRDHFDCRSRKHVPRRRRSSMVRSKRRNGHGHPCKRRTVNDVLPALDLCCAHFDRGSPRYAQIPLIFAKFRSRRHHASWWRFASQRLTLFTDSAWSGAVRFVVVRFAQRRMLRRH
jgi:hypothetical protein